MKSKTPKFIWLLPPILSLGTILIYAINIAHWDDHAIKYSVKNLLESNSTSEQLGLFFSQHNEHRIPITRLLALLSVKILGYLDFRFLMGIGFGFLVGIFLIIKRLYISFELVLMSSILLFIPAFYENQFWGMAAVQNFGVAFFALLVAYFLTKEKLSLAIIFAFVAMFTSANGIVILIAISLFLLLKKNWQWLIVWLFAVILILSLFCYNYAFVPNENNALFSIFDVAKGFVFSAGNIIDFQPIFPKIRWYVLGLIGSIQIGLAAYFLIKMVVKKNLSEVEKFNFIACLFILGTIAGTAISRSNFGLETLLNSKYKLYPFLLLIINFYQLNTTFGNFRKPMISLAIFVFIFSYLFDFQEVINLRNSRIAEYYNGFKSEKSLLKDVFFMKEPKEIIDLQASLPTKTPFQTDFKIDKNQTEYQLSFKPRVVTNNGFLKLKSDSNSYIFPQINKIHDWKSLVKIVLLKQNNPIVIIPKLGIKTGKYSLEILENGLSYQTKDSINIEGQTYINPQKNW